MAAMSKGTAVNAEHYKFGACQTENTLPNRSSGTQSSLNSWLYHSRNQLQLR